MANNKGNLYEKLENMLYEYSALLVGIDNLKAEYEYKSKCLGSPITYDKEQVSKTNAFNSDTENIAMDLVEISKKIALLEIQKNAIDYSFTTLTIEETKVVKLRYFRKFDWETISSECCCNQKTARKMRRDAMRKLSLALLGERL